MLFNINTFASSCADTESFFRGGPTLMVCFVYFFLGGGGWLRDELIQIPLIRGHHGTASETPFK